MQVLVIDDDEAVRQTIALLLEDVGIEVVQAADGKEGLRAFQRARPDLIVTDIIMPEKEGIQTIAEIRASGSKTGIIAISGGGAGSADLYLNMAEELGADATLAKPFRPSDLLSLVLRLLQAR